VWIGRAVDHTGCKHTAGGRVKRKETLLTNASCLRNPLGIPKRFLIDPHGSSTYLCKVEIDVPFAGEEI
jgi:hypothetical protein